MKTVVLTCIKCGATKEVEDTLEAKRNIHCACGEAMVEKRTPGQSETEHSA